MAGSVNVVIPKGLQHGHPYGLGPGKRCLLKRKDPLYFICPTHKTAGRSELWLFFH